MKTTSSVVSSSANREILDALKDPSTSESYLLRIPLNTPEAFLACAQRKNLTTNVLARLLGIVRSGLGDINTLLERPDLNEDQLIILAKSPAVGAAQATKIINHQACSIRAIAELALLDRRREEQRARRGMSRVGSERSGQVLGVLRNGNTLTRLAVMLVDEDIANNAIEITETVDQVIRGGAGSVEVFLTLVKEWHGTTEELIAACHDLA